MEKDQEGTNNAATPSRLGAGRGRGSWAQRYGSSESSTPSRSPLPSNDVSQSPNTNKGAQRGRGTPQSHGKGQGSFS